MKIGDVVQYVNDGVNDILANKIGTIIPMIEGFPEWTPVEEHPDWFAVRFKSPALQVDNHSVWYIHRRLLRCVDEALPDETIARYVQMAQSGSQGDPYVMGVEIARLRTENTQLRSEILTLRARLGNIADLTTMPMPPDWTKR